MKILEGKWGVHL